MCLRDLSEGDQYAGSPLRPWSRVKRSRAPVTGGAQLAHLLRDEAAVLLLPLPHPLLKLSSLPSSCLDSPSCPSSFSTTICSQQPSDEFIQHLLRGKASVLLLPSRTRFSSSSWPMHLRERPSTDQQLLHHHLQGHQDCEEAAAKFIYHHHHQSLLLLNILLLVTSLMVL